jgi:hypothetical protein
VDHIVVAARDTLTSATVPQPASLSSASLLLVHYHATGTNHPSSRLFGKLGYKVALISHAHAPSIISASSPTRSIRTVERCELTCLILLPTRLRPRRVRLYHSQSPSRSDLHRRYGCNQRNVVTSAFTAGKIGIRALSQSLETKQNVCICVSFFGVTTC